MLLSRDPIYLSFFLYLLNEKSYIRMMHKIRRQASSRHLSIGFRYPSRYNRRCFIQ